MVQDILLNELNTKAAQLGLDLNKKDNAFYIRAKTNLTDIYKLYHSLYGNHPSSNQIWNELTESLIRSHSERNAELKKSDQKKEKAGEASENLRQGVDSKETKEKIRQVGDEKKVVQELARTTQGRFSTKELWHPAFNEFEDTSKNAI